MTRIISVLILVSLVNKAGLCQRNQAGTSFALGHQQHSFSFFYSYNWKIGAKKKFGVATGARFSTYFGKNQYYETAPARLTSGSTGPGVLFISNINRNIDSIAVPSAQMNALNLMIDLNYLLSSKFLVGFNIDAIGFSFGNSCTVNYISNGKSLAVPAAPTSFNLLLVSDNDKGSLNSEFYLNYLLNDRWSLKGAIQFLFTEYTTQYSVQQTPSANDRFRNKSLMLAVGIARKF